MKKGHFAKLAVVLAVIFWAAPITGADDNRAQTGLVYGYKVVDIYPHDRSAFTQGLVYDDGALYEGTGSYGASTLRKVDLETGNVQKQIHLLPWIFGEGIALWNDRIVQLTWRSQLGFIYDKESFARTGNFTYRTEGWGLTSDESHLIMSDGSDVLYFLDPVTFQVQKQVRVKDSRGFVRGLNELEYINGEIYANIWTSNEIAVISPKTGVVRAWIDLEGLLPEEDRAGANVLNGIAYDALGDRLFITGKLWPKLFEIDLVVKDK